MIDEEIKRKVIKLYKEYGNAEEVARQLRIDGYKISGQTVRNYLKAYGVKLQRGGNYNPEGRKYIIHPRSLESHVRGRV